MAAVVWYAAIRFTISRAVTVDGGGPGTALTLMAIQLLAVDNTIGEWLAAFGDAAVQNKGPTVGILGASRLFSSVVHD